MLTKLRSTARAGFTLIELLAVILIIGILAFFLVPKIPEALDAAKVTACKANMQEIQKGFLLYKTKFDRAPRGTGVKFFAELVSSGTWENDKSSAKRLTCPNVDIGYLTGIADKPEEEWFKDPAMVDGTYSSYAGRDCEHYPFKTFPPNGNEVLVADDNEGEEPNHRTATVILYGRGVDTLEKADLVKAGLITEDEFLKVGPNSPEKELQKLSLD
ncbi:MAG: prepilin-type N-terminal cleavage/methylation domain-containing protein [Planctomycetes bacterium]|nr:prepilin-type N-terminal cleavage/methylation domain-containing protein [Planctomycetota bacterium]